MMCPANDRMDAKEQLVRDFYAARDRRDWDTVRELLAPGVVWRETEGTESYVGDHHGRDRVADLLATLVEATEGSFRLEPEAVVCTADHAAAAVRWRAERAGAAVEGYDLAVYRIEAGKIAEAWFFQDGYDPAALQEVFSAPAAE